MRRTLHLFVILLFAWGCASSTATTKRDNVAFLYGKGGSIRMAARVHHEREDRSLLYYKVPTQDLLYKSEGGGAPFRATFRLTYLMFGDAAGRELLDSASVVLHDRTQDPSEDKELIGSLVLKRPARARYLLRVSIQDLNRDVMGTSLLEVVQRSEGVRQDFLPMDPQKGLPFFADQRTLAAGPIRVRCERYAGKVLHGSRHPYDTGLPSPVFTLNAPVRKVAPPDSTFLMTVDAEDGTFLFTPTKPGTYHFRPDTADPRGYTLTVLAESYPYVGTGADMLRPLRYITSQQEFDRITKSASVQQAIERFWLDAAGDRERARDAIRIYYSRVENANRHFTAHVEGWRTDRGLVHIIFGIPTAIYRSEKGETWVYGEENNLLSLTFNFVRRDDPYTDNDLLLERDPTLKGAWYRNVESWRNGRVYQN